MKRKLTLVLILLILAGCGKKSNPNPNSTNDTSVLPAAASLTFPDQNAVCTTGTAISPSQSSITFTWNASNNTSSYDLYLKNLLTSVTAIQNTTSTMLTETLATNTPYSWYIVSKSSKTNATAQSNVWKFYNSGPGVVTYAPFPAEIVSPTFNQTITTTTGTINLTWNGSSVNPGTIANYDIYWGTSKSVLILKSAITANYLNNVTVSSNTTYYWKVITRDIDGNTSDSGLYQFSVN